MLFRSLKYTPSCLSRRILEHAVTTPSYAFIEHFYMPPMDGLPLPRVTEIVVSLINLYVVYSNGMSYVFNKFTSEFICELSQLPACKVKTIYYNRINKTIIIIKMSQEDDFNSLQCEYYNDFDIGTENYQMKVKKLFENDVVCSPGFIEFDETNKKILTKARVPPNYKVWSMEDYSLQLYVSHPSIEEIRF